MLNLIPPYEMNPNCRFLGFPMSQNRYAVPAWSYFLEVHQPPRIVEIGTNVGGLTCCLGLAARNYGGKVWSFDTGDTVAAETMDWFRFLGVEFTREDCFSEAGEERIKSLLESPGMALLLCDGGDKKREFNHFARYLKAGDVIAAHDFAGTYWPWQEIQGKDVAKVSYEFGLVDFMGEIFAPTGWLVKVRT